MNRFKAAWWAFRDPALVVLGCDVRQHAWRSLFDGALTVVDYAKSPPHTDYIVPEVTRLTCRQSARVKEIMREFEQ